MRRVVIQTTTVRRQRSEYIVRKRSPSVRGAIKRYRDLLLPESHPTPSSRCQQSHRPVTRFVLGQSSQPEFAEVEQEEWSAGGSFESVDAARNRTRKFRSEVHHSLRQNVYGYGLTVFSPTRNDQDSCFSLISSRVLQSIHKLAVGRASSRFRPISSPQFSQYPKSPEPR